MNLKDKTTDKLRTELKMIKAITAGLVFVLSLLFITCIYGVLTKEDNTTFIALIAVPIALCGMIPLNLSNIKKIKKELELREK